MIKAINTEWLEKEYERLNKIPKTFITQKEEGVLETIKRILNTETIFVNIHPVPVKKSRMEVFNKEIEREKAKKIAKLFCDEVKISNEKLKIRTRKKEICENRQFLVYLLSLYTKLSLTEIAKMYNLKDHSTVIHAKKTITNIIDTESQYNLLFYKLKQKIENEI